MKTLAENVRTARHFNGWTQEQLAQRAGVSQTTIDKIEQGKILRSRFLPHIALALDVPAEALDPTLAKAKEDWNKALKERPQNFYTLKPVAELPMFGMEKTEEFGVFKLTEKPLHEVPSPRLLDGRPAFSVYVQNDLMSPEIGYGDAAFFDERLTLFCGCTGIFMKVERLRSVCVIARLLEISDENFVVSFWKDNYVTRLPIEEWPIARPMVVKYVRNPSEDEG